MSLNQWHIGGGLGRTVLAWLAACLLVISQARAETPGDDNRDILWSAADQGLMLYRGSEPGKLRVCPRVQGQIHQPFCRTFDAAVLSACGLSEDVQLVLANGDVHRVNNALLDARGSMEPVYRPDQPLELVEAWMPEEICHAGETLHDVLAVAASGDLWHFNGENWLQIAEYRKASGRP